MTKTMKPYEPTPRRYSRAFTLIELLVVIGIIAILAAVMIPALKSLTRGNSQKQAVNLMTALIASAHSNALQSHTYAGLVIYDDPSVKNQSSVQLVTALGIDLTQSPPVINFGRTPQTQAQALPLGIAVATLDDSAALFKDPSINANSCRCILFDGNGQLVLRSGLMKDSSIPSSDTAATNWKLSGGTVGVSSPGFVVYDQAMLKAGLTNGTISSSTVGNWFEQNSDVLVVNPYTGNIIR